MNIFLQGQIERITYTNDETGFTVAKVRVEGQRDLVTVVWQFRLPESSSIRLRRTSARAEKRIKQDHQAGADQDDWPQQP